MPSTLPLDVYCHITFDFLYVHDEAYCATHTGYLGLVKAVLSVDVLA